MSETLASSTLAVARGLGGLLNLVEGKATGGSTTTLVDAAFPWLSDGASAPPADYYNGGTLWLLSGNNAGRTAPVTDWAVSGAQGTATFAAISGGGAVANGDAYAIAPRQFPRYALRQAVNAALGEIGNVDQQYTNASFVTVVNEVEYSLPAGVFNVLRVEVSATKAEPYRWRRYHHWREIGGKIQFRPRFAPGFSGHLIRLTYNAPLASLDDDTDAIPDLIPLEWVKWAGVVAACRWRVGMTGAGQRDSVQALNDAIRIAQEKAAANRPVLQQMPRDPQYSGWAGIEREPVESEPDLFRD